MSKPPSKDIATRLQSVDNTSMEVRRIELIAAIAERQADLARRRASIAADEQILARYFLELSAIEKKDYVKAAALAPPRPAYLKTGEAAKLLRCNEATAKKKGEKHGFAFKRDGRWLFSEPDLAAYVAGLA